MNLQKWFLSKYFKISGTRLKDQTSGFSLIELLVAIILSFLIITPLMTFMISIMNNDRVEEAKTTSDQELRAALDYMVRDLQQAVYIYDADGINSIRKYLPEYNNTNQYFPVLVFWKRQFIKQALNINSESQQSTTTVTTTNGTDDTFVFSLVAYYLINDGSSTWSNAARIGRFEISNGYGENATDIAATTDVDFQLFNLSGPGSLKSKMDNWTSASGTYTKYTQQIIPLTDYIDQSPVNSSTNPSPSCSVGQVVPNFAGTTGDSVPPTTTSSATSPNTNILGFYVCVDTTQYYPVVEIHLRGNAYARLQQDTQQNTLYYSKNNPSISMYFPQFVSRVQGNGYLYTNVNN